MTTLKARGIGVAYGRKRVLREVELDLPEGATLLLGPNGAGKSTLLEVLASLRRPSTGDVQIEGVGSPGPSRAALRRYRSAVAWLPQSFAPYPGLVVREHVALAGWLKGMSRRAAWDRSLAALGAVDLTARADTPVKVLSGGQLRRLGIAGALVHDARVVLMDEPTAGLDPSQRVRFRSALEELGHSRAVLLSSHDTEGAVDRYERVIVLSAGRVRFSGAPRDFIGGTPASLSLGERFRAAYEAQTGSEG